MKVAFFRLSALGDCVLATAAVNAILTKYPNCELTWITTSAVAELLNGMPKVKFMVIKKPKSFSDYLKLRNQFSDMTFDVLLAAQASLRANFIYPFIKAERKIGFDNSRARDLHRLFVNEQIDYADEHLAQGFMRFAAHLSARSEQYQWYIDNTADIPVFKNDNPTYTVVLNIAASKQERTWPATHYAQLIKRLHSEFDCRVILIGGNSELEKAQEAEIIKLTESNSCINLVGKTNLPELTSVIHSGDLLVSPDSGPVHIATALNVPVVGLYAVARPELSGPFQAMDYTVNKYPLAVSSFLNKPVEQARWHERVHGSNVMALISVDDVFDAIERCLSSRTILKNQLVNAR